MAPVYMSTLYGQFLLLQFDSVGSVFIIRTLVAVYALLGRLVTRSPVDLNITVEHPPRTAEALMATPEITEIGPIRFFPTITFITHITDITSFPHINQIPYPRTYPTPP